MRPRTRFSLTSRRARIRIAVLVALLAAAIGGCTVMTGMPGKSHSGPLPALTEKEADLAGRLRRHVEELAGRIGVRDLTRPRALEAAARYVEEQLQAAGLETLGHTLQVDRMDCRNLETEIPGAQSPREIVIVGAHYDTCENPGANDNASGTAAVLELSRLFARKRLPRTLRFVAFVNEEPPYFQTANMGSLVYARRSRERGEDVVAMLSLETMGYFSDERGSQRYPFPFGLLYPSTGNFIGFVGNYGSRRLVRHAVGVFRESCKFPSEGGAIPGFVPGVGWSDHWSFWQAGYPALMVTDTAPFRYPHYHSSTDTPEKLDYERLARVVAGVEKVIEDLASTTERFR